MSSYQITSSGTIRRLSDDALIPPDVRNTDYQEYLMWLAAGNQPTQEPVPPLTAAITVSERLEALELLVDFLLEGQA